VLKRNGGYVIKTFTTNAPLDVKFEAAPASAPLYYYGGTTNAPTTVSLQPTFEGTFQLTSTVLAPSVVPNANVEDPSGNNRTRVIATRRTGRFQLLGDVYWGQKDRHTPAGSVEIQTSNMFNVLRL